MDHLFQQFRLSTTQLILPHVQQWLSFLIDVLASTVHVKMSA